MKLTTKLCVTGHCEVSVMPRRNLKKTKFHVHHKTNTIIHVLIKGFFMSRDRMDKSGNVNNERCSGVSEIEASEGTFPIFYYTK